MLRRLLAFLALLVPLYVAAQTQIEPVGQIAWPALSGAGAPSQYCPTTVTGTTISGSPSVAVSTTVGVLPSQTVVGTGVPSSTTVRRMNASANTITLSANAAASGIVSLTFFSYGMPYTDTVAHLVYYCVGSSGWQLLNGSAVAGAGFRLPAYPSSAGLAAPSNVTTDVTGNNLTVPGTATATAFVGSGAALTGTASALSIPYANLTGGVPTWNQNTTGTAANVTGTSNSTLTSLPSLLLPYSQLSGSAPTWNQSTTGVAANVTGTSNSTLTALPSLLLPYAQLSGSAPTWNQNTTGTAANITGSSNSTLTSLSALTTAASLSLPYGQLSGSPPTWNQNTTGTAVNLSGSQTQHFVYAAPSGSAGNGGFRALVASDVPTLNQNTTGTAANVTGSSNSTLTTLPSLLLPYAQLSGSAPTWNQDTTGTASNVSGTPALPNGVTATSQSPVDVSSGKLATQLSVANMFASPPVQGSTTPNAVIATTLTATGLGNSTAPVCPNGTSNALTTVGCVLGGTGITNQAANIVALGGTATTITGQAHINEGTAGTTTFTQSVMLDSSSNTATGLRAPSANAAVTSYSVLAFGAVPDAPAYDFGLSFSLTSGNDIITVTGAGFTAQNIVSRNGTPKWVCLNANHQVWSAVPFSGGAPYCATITSFVDSNHVHISRTAANSVTGVVRWGTDNTPAFNACAAAVYAASAASNSSAGGTCTIPSAGTGTYLMATQPYYLLVKGVDQGVDDGSYLQQGGGSGAVIASAISGGSITGWTVSNGGSGYTPSSTLQVAIAGGGCLGNQFPCGFAFALASTNSSGVVTSVANAFPGYGFLSPPTGTVTPLGGDGVTATVTLSAGTTSTPSLGAAGAGYGSGGTLTYYLINATTGASGCTVLRTLTGGVQIVGSGTATMSGGSATGAFTVTANGTGCTNPPSVVFSDFGECNSGTLGSPVWTQCTNLTPINPVKVPVQVIVPQAVNFKGESGGGFNAVTLVGNFDKSTLDSNASAMFGNIEIYHSDLGNFNIASDSLIGILSTSYVNYSYIHDISFAGNAIGMFTVASDTQSRYNNLSFDGGIATWVNGGTWSHRDDFPRGQGGEFDADSINDLIIRPLAYGGPGSFGQRLDDWFANNFWHPEFTGASTDWPTGEVCKFPQSVNQRQTGQNMAAGLQGYTANVICYRGIASVGMAVYTRDDRGSGNATISQFRVKQLSRPAFIGSLGGMSISNVGEEAAVPLATDPYRNAAKQEGLIVYSGTGSSSGQTPFINGTNYVSATTNILSTMWDIANQGVPANTYWINNVPSQSVDNPQANSNPNFLGQIQFSGGLSIPVQTNTGVGQPFDIYNNDGGGVYNLDLRIKSDYGGLDFYTGHCTATPPVSGVAPTCGSLNNRVDITESGLNLIGATTPLLMAGAPGTSSQVLASQGAGNTPHWVAAVVVPISGTTGSIGGGALLVNACASGTATVTGLTTAMALVVTPAADPNTPGTQSYDWYAVRTGANQATVYVCAVIAGTPAATTYNVRAIQ